MSTAMALSTGELTRIGDGPVATVYSGHRDNVPVAYKVFGKKFDKRTMSAYGKERSALAAQRRVTSILQVDGIDELSGGELALRMELCTQSLARVVERYGPVAPDDVIKVGRAAAMALAAAHRAGVVHGGISPHNVLFRQSGEPVVSDFGLTLRHALARDPLHAIEYLPPETLRTGVLNESTDLYGLGAVLHFALTGRSPHPGRLGEQPGERVLRILGGPVPAINTPGVPTPLATLVARLLATDPSRRPPDAGQVADQIGVLLPDPTPRTQSDSGFDDFDMSGPAHRVHRVPPPPQPPRQQWAPQSPPRQQPPPPAADTLDDFDDFSSSGSAPSRPTPPPPPAIAQGQRTGSQPMPPPGSRPVPPPQRSDSAPIPPRPPSRQGTGPVPPGRPVPPGQHSGSHPIPPGHRPNPSATPADHRADSTPMAPGPHSVPADRPTSGPVAPAQQPGPRSDSAPVSPGQRSDSGLVAPGQQPGPVQPASGPGATGQQPDPRSDSAPASPGQRSDAGLAPGQQSGPRPIHPASGPGMSGRQSDPHSDSASVAPAQQPGPRSDSASVAPGQRPDAGPVAPGRQSGPRPVQPASGPAATGQQPDPRSDSAPASPGQRPDAGPVAPGRQSGPRPIQPASGPAATGQSDPRSDSVPVAPGQRPESAPAAPGQQSGSYPVQPASGPGELGQLSVPADHRSNSGSVSPAQQPGPRSDSAPVAPGQQSGPRPVQPGSGPVELGQQSDPRADSARVAPGQQSRPHPVQPASGSAGSGSHSVPSAQHSTSAPGGPDQQPGPTTPGQQPVPSGERSKPGLVLSGQQPGSPGLRSDSDPPRSTHQPPPAGPQSDSRPRQSGHQPPAQSASTGQRSGSYLVPSAEWSDSRPQRPAQPAAGQHANGQPTSGQPGPQSGSSLAPPVERPTQHQPAPAGQEPGPRSDSGPTAQQAGFSPVPPAQPSGSYPVVPDHQPGQHTGSSPTVTSGQPGQSGPSTGRLPSLPASAPRAFPLPPPGPFPPGTVAPPIVPWATQPDDNGTTRGTSSWFPDAEPAPGAGRRAPVLGAPPPALAKALGLDPIEPETPADPPPVPERKAPTTGSELSSAFQMRTAGAPTQQVPAQPEAEPEAEPTEQPTSAPEAPFDLPDVAQPAVRPPAVDLGDESTWADSGLTTELPAIGDDGPRSPDAPDDFAPETYARPDPYGMSSSSFADDFGGYGRSEVDTKPKTKPKRRFRYEIAGGVVLIGLVIALVVLLLGGDPETMPTSSPAAEVPGADPKAVNLVLAPPDDNGTKVNLSWRSSRELDFAVVVAAEGKHNEVLMANRNHSMTIEVDPNLKYCFLVQATDGNNVYESKALPIRGATCKK
jgi:protein kinase-like protein